MCGICCSISRNEYPSPVEKSVEKLNALLKCRGPDSSFERIIHDFGPKHHQLKLSSHILWTQGIENLTEQPIVNEDETTLFVFNGDIYSFSAGFLESQNDDGVKNGSVICENDGLYLFNLLHKCQTTTELLNVISRLQGPYAFILVNISKNQIWFGRDFFGRSSLLLSIDDNNSAENYSFCISSVAPVNEFGNVCEIPSAGLFCLDFSGENDPTLSIFPWNCPSYRHHIEENTEQFIQFLKCKLQFNVHIMKDLKVNCVSTKLKGIPNDFNFDNGSLGNNITNTVLAELSKLSKSRLKPNELLLKATLTLQDSVKTFLECLRKAVKQRVVLKPPYCKDCILTKYTSKNEDEKMNNKKEVKCTHSKIGILFSGGLDSTVLAYLVAEILPKGETLDLINVAFAPDEVSNFNVPDRQTGLQSYNVLKQIFEPRGVKFNFIEANVTKSSVTEIRKDFILDLISPLQSVLDDSIGICLWFASRAQGQVKHLNKDEGKEELLPYKSPSRILMVGSGADELLGGYSRHRSAFENKSWQGLLDEMQEDIDRISSRNLGRDNRVITNHGVVPRMPFLDENVVHFITQECDLWVKCCPLFPRGVGEKILLRCLAVQIFGEENSHLALFPKRAMQFGSRIAKLENSKEKGSDVCHRLKVQAGE